MPGVDDIDGVDLMPLETPVLKVSRPVAACSRCRTAKIKCDGKLPVSQAMSLSNDLSGVDVLTIGMHIVREKWPGRRMYEHKRSIR